MENNFVELTELFRDEEKSNDKGQLTEQTRTHSVCVYIDSKGGDVVLSFGQLVKESHNVQPCVLQKSKPYC